MIERYHALFIETMDVLTDAQIRELFSMDGDDRLPDINQVCGGEWRRHVDGLHHFWRDPEWEETE